MRSLIAGAAGLLLVLVAGGLLNHSVGPHTERIFISGNSSPFFVSKPDLRFGSRFEVDYAFDTTFEISSTAGQAVDFQIDGSPTGEPCRIRFSDPGTKVCQSKVIRILPNAPPQELSATAENMGILDYYLGDMFGYPLYPSAVMVGKAGEILVPIDPELELEREYSTFSLVAILMALLSFGLAWRWRRRRQD